MAVGGRLCRLPLFNRDLIVSLMVWCHCSWALWQVIMLSAVMTQVLMHQAGYKTASPFTSGGYAGVLAWLCLLVWLASRQYEMSYACFHMLFTVPPLVLLGRRAFLAGELVGELGVRVRGLRGSCVMSACVLSLLSLLWTTPWDNYLVYKYVLLPSISITA